ncbi:glycerophosphodiester phosphodiesterase family protein [Asticcacaulis sp. 201]|uniref:glycerophosphodiester phosphodiesterase family protein n=1 Tax=Asticcacaulis sp. 201 TaxID=3028787 RepID=UPI002916FFF4|nr:glycerophosphodiester phosphodiesterase family protein [Asticcacaulis sp. 201]MDV6333054.1 glycerophosphodiester phosphodiesterase family protein [Asticcacaulis sp. 201]
MVVAHRGCHNAAPQSHLEATPENSFEGLDHCVSLGVDMMELDVRRTKDGALVIMHDATVDRTTNGKGRLADMTLAQVKQLKLRQNFGGSMSPTLTDQTVPTLDEILDYARGRILLNLDIKEEIYPEVIAAAEAKNMAPYVLVKRVIADDVSPIVDQAPYDSVPFMPIIGHWPAAPANFDVTRIAARQVASQHRLIGVEMVYLTPDEFAAIGKITHDAKIRLWGNSLTSVGVISVIGLGGDTDALRISGQAWGEMIEKGVNVIQTDEPGPLIDYLNRKNIKH